MAARFQLVIDCADPEPLARFWAAALGYELEPPPDGFASWDAYWRDLGVPEDELGTGADCIVDPSGRHRFEMSAPLEFDHGHFSGVAMAQLPANGHILASTWWESDDDRTFPQFEYAADGTLLRRSDVPTLPMPSEHSPTLATLLGMGTPLAAVTVYHPWRLERNFHIRRHMGPYWNLFLNSLMASASFSAIVTILLAWFYGFSKTRVIIWTIISALIGVSGVIILLSLYDWPVRDRCPGCGRERPVGEPLCRRCGSPHAPPEMNGREIFEPCDAMVAV